MGSLLFNYFVVESLTAAVNFWATCILRASSAEYSDARIRSSGGQVSPLPRAVVEKQLCGGEEEELVKSSSPGDSLTMAVKSTAKLEFSPLQAVLL